MTIEERVLSAALQKAVPQRRAPTVWPPYTPTYVAHPTPAALVLSSQPELANQSTVLTGNSLVSSRVFAEEQVFLQRMNTYLQQNKDRIVDDVVAAVSEFRMTRDDVLANMSIEYEARLGRVYNRNFVPGISRSEFEHFANAPPPAQAQGQAQQRSCVDMTTYAYEGNLRVREIIRDSESGIAREATYKFIIDSCTLQLSIEELHTHALFTYYWPQTPPAVRFSCAVEVAIRPHDVDAPISIMRTRLSQLRIVRIARRRSILVNANESIDCTVVYPGSTYAEAKKLVAEAQRILSASETPAGSISPGVVYEVECERVVPWKEVGAGLLCAAVGPSLFACWKK